MFRSALLSRLLFFSECCVCCGWLIRAGNYVVGQVSVNGCIFCFSSALWTPPSLSEVRHCLDSLGLLTNYTQPFMSTRAAPWRLDLPITSTTINLEQEAVRLGYGLHKCFETEEGGARGLKFNSTSVARHSSCLSWASCICSGRFGKLFRRQEASGWDQEAVHFVCLLHGALGPSKEAGILWFEHLLQVLLSANTFRLQHFPVNV